MGSHRVVHDLSDLAAAVTVHVHHRRKKKTNQMNSTSVVIWILNSNIRKVEMLQVIFASLSIKWHNLVHSQCFYFYSQKTYQVALDRIKQTKGSKMVTLLQVRWSIPIWGSSKNKRIETKAEFKSLKLGFLVTLTLVWSLIHLNKLCDFGKAA